MATNSDQFKYAADETEETRTARCSMCSEDGLYTPARHYCVDCELYYCGNCVKSHARIPALKSHQVNDIDSSISTSGDDQTNNRKEFPAEVVRCQIHQGKLIDTHCKDHDEVCCGTCALVKHRLCSTESIANASKDFQSIPEANKCKDALTQILIQLTEGKQTRTDTMDHIGKQKLQLIETVDKYEDRVIAKIKELANISRKKIRSKYDEDKTALDMDVAALDAAMATTSDYVNKLEVHAPVNDTVLFATVKNSKVVTRDGENLLQAMKKEWKNWEIKFLFDNMLENTVDGMKSLCVLEVKCTVIEYEAKFQTNVQVLRGNEERTSVFDMCLMDTGDLLFTDHHNQKLKRFDSNLQYYDAIQLSGYPYAVCKIGKHVVAVSISSKTVYFVSVGQSMKLTSSFKLDAFAYGMTYDDGTEEIFACEDNKVSVYSKSGNKLRTYDKTTNGENMFSKCKQIELSENKQDIYVTDNDGAVVVLDKSGHLKMKVPLSDINDAWPLCLLPGNICLTGSRYSGRIVQIDKDGKQIATLIDTQDERTSTFCAVYDREHSRLLVGGWPDVISVYKISTKCSYNHKDTHNVA